MVLIPRSLLSTTTRRVSRVRVVARASTRLGPANRMATASIPYKLLFLGNHMSTLVGTRAWIDGMDMIDATAGGIFLDELDAHGGRRPGDVIGIGMSRLSGEDRVVCLMLAGRTVVCYVRG